MSLRYREVATREALRILSGSKMLPEKLGELYNDGKATTEKQTEKVDKHFQKLVARFKLRLDKIDAKSETRKPKAKPSKEKMEKPKVEKAKAAKEPSPKKEPVAPKKEAAAPKKIERKR